jgi:hypothetical protein
MNTENNVASRSFGVDLVLPGLSCVVLSMTSLYNIWKHWIA